MRNMLVNSRLIFGTSICAATAWADFFGQAVIKPFWTSPSTISVSSSNAADVMTSGNGAWIVRVWGLNSAFEIIYEDLQLNGQTEVTGTKQFYRVNSAEVILAKDGYTNVGDIYVYGSGDTPASGVPAAPATYLGAKIIAGEGIGRSCSFTVPNGSPVKIHGMILGQYDTAARYVRLRYGIRNAGENIFKYYPFGSLISAATSIAQVEFNSPIVVPARADFRLQSYGSAAGSTCDACLIVTEAE